MENDVPDQPDPQITASATSGPLTGFRVVEFAGIGPGPFACMMLADMGAEVITLDRPGANKNQKSATGRGRKIIELDLKDTAARAQTLDLLEQADALIEGFRPGVMERLGLGPNVVLSRNPRLVYGRMTGWGQEGPLAQAAGHDINYIAVTGALAAIGPAERPVPPLNLVGDFGGGALYLVVGVLAALLEARKSGQGQVVDAAMCDGAASLMTMERRERAQLPRRRRAFLRRLSMRLRPFHLDRVDRAAILRSAAAACRPVGSGVRCPDGLRGVALAEAETGRRFQSQNPRRVVQDHGRHPHLFRAGAELVGSATSPSLGGPKDFR
jgi:crotonobetainyl-CoA:carnitine CoA-transferase CaiB-like acyl-CoA transferase